MYMYICILHYRNYTYSMVSIYCIYFIHCLCDILYTIYCMYFLMCTYIYVYIYTHLLV